LRPYRAGHRREPGDGSGPRRRHAPRVSPRLHAGRRAGHGGRRARHPGHRGRERDGHRGHRGGLRGRRDRGSGQHARRRHRRAHRGTAEGRRHRDVARGRDAGHLRRGHRRPGAATGRPLRRRHVVIGRIAVLAGVTALVVAPLVAPPYQLTLLLPAFAYGIALLGLNLLFGTTGLLSFGHALFVALGAYTAAWLTTHTRVRALELLVLTAATLAVLVAVPVGLLCV